MRTLWLGILPGPETTRVMLEDRKRVWLRGRLPHSPRDPRALELLTEALGLWCGRQVCTAIAVEGPGAFCATRRWLATFEHVSRPSRFEIHCVSHGLEAEGRDPDPDVPDYRQLRCEILSGVRR